MPAEGEPADLAGLFERHAASLLRYCTRRVGPAAAEDVVAETFLVAAERRAGLGVEPVALLYGIATNLLRTHRRKEVRGYRALARYGRELDVGDAADQVADRVDADSGVRQLGQILAELPARDRDVLLLYAWGDLSYAEVATAMGIPVGTVRSRLNRTRARLRSAWPATVTPPGPSRDMTFRWE